MLGDQLETVVITTREVITSSVDKDNLFPKRFSPNSTFGDNLHVLPSFDHKQNRYFIPLKSLPNMISILGPILFLLFIYGSIPDGALSNVGIYTDGITTYSGSHTCDYFERAGLVADLEILNWYLMLSIMYVTLLNGVKCG